MGGAVWMLLTGCLSRLILRFPAVSMILSCMILSILPLWLPLRCFALQ
jgi:hypothetical protein